jgi:hypothetical protein
MPYDALKEPHSVRSNAPTGATFGGSGAPITPHNTNDLATIAKAIVVTAAGNLVILPAKNDDATTITFTGVPVGFIPPFRVRRVLATGTTASVATIGD